MKVIKGLCECGCGTIIVIRDRWGRDRRYAKGHHRKKLDGPVLIGGYEAIRMPDHPKAMYGSGYVMKHLIDAERALGKPLPSGAEVHHMDGSKKGPICICQSKSYHRLLHRRLDAYRACGNPNWRKCQFCGEYSPPDHLYINNTMVCHRNCANEYQRYRLLSKDTCVGDYE